ncbi:MAG TPA: hypothetical protein VGJ73_01405 [Verrucomicrobiae bacterium]
MEQGLMMHLQRKISTMCLIVLTRTQNLGGIPFTQPLDFAFELMSWKPTKLIYAMTTYWYAFPGATSNVRPQLDAATLNVPTLIDAQKQPVF